MCFNVSENFNRVLFMLIQSYKYWGKRRKKQFFRQSSFWMEGLVFVVFSLHFSWMDNIQRNFALCMHRDMMPSGKDTIRLIENGPIIQRNKPQVRCVSPFTDMFLPAYPRFFLKKQNIAGFIQCLSDLVRSTAFCSNERKPLPPKLERLEGRTRLAGPRKGRANLLHKHYEHSVNK